MRRAPDISWKSGTPLSPVWRAVNGKTSRSPATFYEFVAVFESRRFKVIVKQAPGQEIVFWSLIPFWRQTEQGTRVLHDGNLAED